MLRLVFLFLSDRLIPASSAKLPHESKLIRFISVCALASQSPFMEKHSTYRINVYTFNKTLEFTDRIKKIDVSI